MMLDAVDVRVVLIGLVALVVAFYEGGSADRSAGTTRLMRPAVVSCQTGLDPLHADVAANLGRAAIGLSACR